MDDGLTVKEKSDCRSDMASWLRSVTVTDQHKHDTTLSQQYNRTECEQGVQCGMLSATTFELEAGVAGREPREVVAAFGPSCRSLMLHVLSQVLCL